MLDRIGFDRVVKLNWLNKTVEIYNQEKDFKKVKLNLDYYLRDDVGGDNRRKTINILIRTWVNVDPGHGSIRDKALGLFKLADANERIAIHWSMLLLAYPIFDNLTAAAGKLLNLQDEFSLSMVRRRIYELWGERSTLQYAIDKMIRSQIDWGVLSDGEKPGEYKRIQPLEIKNAEVKLLLIEAYLLASGKPHLQFVEVNKLDEMFPFKLDIGLDDFHTVDKFKLNKMGGEVVIGL